MTRPVDIDGTPLHVGDLVESAWYGRGAARYLRHVDHIRAGESEWVGTPQGEVVARAFRKVPESRHDRIARMSYVRPQVVQVEIGCERMWARVADGRACPVGPADDDRRYALKHPVGHCALSAPDDGIWRIP